MAVRAGSSPFNVEALTAAGSTQADATAVTARSSPALLVVGGADDIVGIRLPPAAKGKVYYIKSIGTGGISHALKVYPATGDAINALSANTALVMASLASAIFVAKDATTWYTIPTLPS